MTGEKNRFTTTEKLWNLDDKQLTTPKHDEIVLSITPNIVLSILPDSVLSSVKDIKNWFNDLDETPINRLQAKERAIRSRIKKDGIEGDTINGMYSANRDIIPNFRFNLSDIERSKILYEIEEDIPKYIEKSVQSAARYKMFSEVISTSLDASKMYEISYEVPIMAQNGFLVGYWDIVLSPTIRSFKIRIPDETVISGNFNTSGLLPQIFIEVKPSIDSFGATIRQINTYKTYLGRMERNWNYADPPIICLVTPDIRFKTAFESQGIRVVSP